MNAGADAPLSVYLVVGEESGDQPGDAAGAVDPDAHERREGALAQVCLREVVRQRVCAGDAHAARDFLRLVAHLLPEQIHPCMHENGGLAQ